MLKFSFRDTNANLEDVMDMWNVTEDQFEKYRQELIQEGLLGFDG